MRVKAFSGLNLEADSTVAAQSAEGAVLESFGAEEPRLLLVYGTINHEQAELLESIRSVVGPAPQIIGCSAQGIVSNGELVEEGYGVGIMGFGGSELVAATAIESEAPRDKGRSLAARLKAQLGRDPDLGGIHYDASCGTNVQEMLPVWMPSFPALWGGGASLSWGLPVSTFQYHDTQAVHRSLVGFALAGPFAA